MPIIEEAGKRTEILDLLTRAYWMEIETVMNYISPLGQPRWRARREIKKSLAADVTAEIGHAQHCAAQSDLATACNGCQNRGGENGHGRPRSGDEDE